MTRPSAKRRILVHSLVGGIALVASLFAGTSPAAAADGVCHTGDMCTWEDSGYSGGFYDFPGSDSSFSNNNFYVTGNVVNDRITSLHNYDATCTANMWGNYNYMNDPGKINSVYYPPGTGDSNLWWGLTNDQYSSISWTC